MKYFIDIVGLETLEHQERWEEARILLYKMWLNDKSNPGILIRLIFECWFVLAEWYCQIDTENLSFQTFQNTLIEATDYGIQKQEGNFRFLGILGYMISMFPYLFCINGTERLYTDWEQRGIERLRLAYERDPNDLIAKAFWLGTKNGEKEYADTKKQLLPILDALFPNDTAVEKYFKEILTP